MAHGCGAKPQVLLKFVRKIWTSLLRSCWWVLIIMRWLWELRVWRLLVSSTGRWAWVNNLLGVVGNDKLSIGGLQSRTGM